MQGLVVKTERKDAPSGSYSPPARAAVSERTSVRLTFSLSFELVPLRLAANSRMRHIVMLSLTAFPFLNRISRRLVLYANSFLIYKPTYVL